MTTIVAPIITEGGTGLRVLLAQNADATCAIGQAIEALRIAMPQRCDYQKEALFLVAEFQHFTRLEHLFDMLSEMEHIGKTLQGVEEEIA